MSRKAEHLQDFLLRDETPTGMVIGSIETGRWKAEDGVSHTYDKLNRVMPNLANAWEDITAAPCVGAPCDPPATLIGMGFTRDSSHLQRASFETLPVCYDQVLSADRAKRQWSHVIETLRDATKLINDDKLLTEYFRLAGHHWICSMTAPNLLPFTFTETGQLINVNCVDQNGAAIIPDSKLVVNMLKQRIEYQRLAGSLGKVVTGQPEVIEVFTDLNTIWELVQGDTSVADHWRFETFDVGSKEYHQYGWTARVGNFMLHALLHPLRFQITGTTLNRVFPYLNIPATVGIKGVPNPYYINAPVGCTMIWHRRMFRWLVRDTTSINPMMPFAARDFSGKWQFIMDNLSCGTARATNPTTGAAIDVPIFLPNPLRNKGIFHADFAGAAEAQFPEYGEVFLHRVEQPCIVGQPPCASTPDYVFQDYSSENEPCD